MLMFTAKVYGKTEDCEVEGINAIMYTDYRMVRPGNVGTRFLSAMLDGGKSGVEMGMAIIPGVLIICTFVMMLTNGPSADGTYTGAAYEGIALLPAIGDKLEFILQPLFGFTSSQGVSVPITRRARPSAWFRRWCRTGWQAATTSRFSPPCACAGAAT